MTIHQPPIPVVTAPNLINHKKNKIRTPTTVYITKLQKLLLVIGYLLPGSMCHGIERKERLVCLRQGFEKRESGETWNIDEMWWKWMWGVGEWGV